MTDPKRIVSNIGKAGVDSIRIGGMSIQTLPMVQMAHTKQQWPDILASNTQQEIENIIGEYPKTTIPYLLSRIVECEACIVKNHEVIAGLHTKINEYSTHIGLCAHRDKEIEKLDAAADKAEISKLKLKYPPYNVAAMQQQIVQFQESIERFNEGNRKENDSIGELREAISQLHRRDERLKEYGVSVSA